KENPNWPRHTRPNPHHAMSAPPAIILHGRSYAMFTLPVILPNRGNRTIPPMPKILSNQAFHVIHFKAFLDIPLIVEMAGKLSIPMSFSTVLTHTTSDTLMSPDTVDIPMSPSTEEISVDLSIRQITLCLSVTLELVHLKAKMVPLPGMAWIIALLNLAQTLVRPTSVKLLVLLRMSKLPRAFI
ncbi:hypothetical protein BGX31_002708, partial [Mortierella sp. GBA43]